jgi:hypothetical protein
MAAKGRAEPMKYVQTRWAQSAPDEPVCFYEEIEDGKPLRFIEEFADGTFGFATAAHAQGGTWLPEQSCHAGDGEETPEYKCTHITAGEFEAVWNRAQGSIRLTGGSE